MMGFEPGNGINKIVFIAGHDLKVQVIAGRVPGRAHCPQLVASFNLLSHAHRKRSRKHVFVLGVNSFPIDNMFNPHRIASPTHGADKIYYPIG